MGKPKVIRSLIICDAALDGMLVTVTLRQPTGFGRRRFTSSYDLDCADDVRQFAELCHMAGLNSIADTDDLIGHAINFHVWPDSIDRQAA